MSTNISSLIHLPFPPSVNHYWQSRVIKRTGGKPPFVSTYLSAKGKAYKAEVALLAKQHQVKPQTGPLAVSISVYPPDQRKRDLDNLCKSLLDAMTDAGFWEDDSQIDLLIIRRCGLRPGGAVEVDVSAIPVTDGDLQIKTGPSVWR